MKQIEIKIPEKIGVVQDKKTHAKYITLPFDFEGGYQGAVVLMKLWKAPWIPNKDIESIIINLK